jgi:PIN domain nuclease of toxin-antitoxin system
VVLLDTHVWFWAVSGDGRRLGRRTRSLLQRAGQRGELRVSALSIFEVVSLHAGGRMRLDREPGRWVRDALDVAGLRVAELTAAMAEIAGAIPRNLLADPVDRMLVATARASEALLMTGDARILDYAGASRVIRTHDART